MSLFTQEGFLFLLRWFHFLAGITWIGILYYLNFVQTPYFATDLGGQARSADDARAHAERAVVVPLGGDVHVPDRLDDRAHAHRDRHRLDAVLRDDPDGRNPRNVHVVQRVVRDHAASAARDRVG